MKIVDSLPKVLLCDEVYEYSITESMHFKGEYSRPIRSPSRGGLAEDMGGICVWRAISTWRARQNDFVGEAQLIEFPTSRGPVSP